MSVSVVLKNVCHTTGEGPHWDEKTNELLFVDINENTAHRWNSVTGEHSKKRYDGPVGLVVPAQSGGYVIGIGRALCHIDAVTGDVTKTYGEVDKDRTNTRINDGKCDQSGRLWAGTMGLEPLTDPLDREAGSLYSLDTEGNVSHHLSKIGISNGLAWTADGQTVYYIDSIPRKVYAFDCDQEKGIISNQRVVVDFPARSYTGAPDGMCIDSEDKIWVACFSGSRIVRFDPETGQELQSISFPVSRMTSCCWGGPNMDELYATCGKAGLTEEQFKNEEPLAGSVFKVTGLGVKGVPSNIYRG